MTPEQLAHLRQWAEWGESPTPETTIALLDLVDTLTKRLEAVRELHKPIRIYDECWHESCPHDPVEVSDYYGCADTFIGYACENCCFGDTEYMQEWCPHGLDHDGLTEKRACPTRQAADGD